MANVSKMMRIGAAFTLLSLFGGTMVSAEIIEPAELPSDVESLSATPGDA